MPARVQWLWYVVVGLVLLGAAAVAWGYVNRHDLSWYHSATVVAGVMLPALAAQVTGTLGDAARYFDDHPANVAVRTRVRDSVIRLLEDLHTEGRYERIVVIGHSLGSAVAYDALRLLWARRMADVDLQRSNAGDLDDFDQEAAQAAANLGVWAQGEGAQHLGDSTFPQTEADAFDEWQTARSNLFERLTKVPYHHDPAWLVSDFISVGAAVAHVGLLLAPPGTTCAELVHERELPACPPLPATPDANPRPGEPRLGTPTFRFARHPTRDAAGVWRVQFHHGAMFAVTRWTNVYTTGDFVGGPVRADRTQSPELWAGAHNIRFSAWRTSQVVQRRGHRPPEDVRKVGWLATLPVLSHSRYWTKSPWLHNAEGVTQFVSILDGAVRDAQHEERGGGHA